MAKSGGNFGGYENGIAFDGFEDFFDLILICTRGERYTVFFTEGKGCDGTACG